MSDDQSTHPPFCPGRDGAPSCQLAWTHDDVCEPEAPDFWALLETPPPGCEAVADLWHWSTNHDAGKGPATLFLDLIGWSRSELGQALYNLDDASLGYLEIDKLASALTEYSDAPTVVTDYVETLLNAEGSR